MGIWLLLLLLPVASRLLRVAYRLYITPLSKIPGPRWAAISSLYEMYYDFVEPARFPWKIDELHERYGPIVRIGPNEVHINDPAYADTHFGVKYKQNKFAGHENHFGMPQSTFSTVDNDLHKLRRSALLPFFSRRSTNVVEPMIRQKVEKTANHLAKAKEAKTPLDLRLLFSCMTTDIVTDYAFPHCFNLLDTSDLAPDWRHSFANGLRNFHWFKHFPFLWSVLRSIPEATLVKLSPDMKITQDWENNNKKLVRTIVDEFDPYNRRTDQPTIFHELLASDLPPEEKTFERLWQEGAALIGAGVETTSNTLNVTLYHLIENPKLWKQLKAELVECMPDPAVLAPWRDLEKLPYLSAVLNEGLRVAMGTTSRIIRVSPEATIDYGGFKIPPGTSVSMSILPLHKHSEIYSDPERFEPDRWLHKNKRPDLFVFGRGTRACAGQNLAWAELYTALAAIVRRFELELYDTVYERDVAAVCDAFMPMPTQGTKGVRVMVK